MDLFRRKVLKVDKPRVHKVKDSFGVYDAYKWLRRNKWPGIGHTVTEHLFYSIVRNINNSLADSLIGGNDIELPHRLGKIEVRKFDARIDFQNGKVVTNLPVDWDRTLTLWADDEESYRNKVLIKLEEKEMFKILYNRTKAKYINKCFFEFRANREIKKRLKQVIKERRFDAFHV